MSDPTLALARQIIACHSVTPDDAGCMEIITERLKPLGFNIEFINRNGVTNLWARRGTDQTAVRLCRPYRCRANRAIGQMDFAALRSGNPRRHALRRGTADMKSSIAAMLTAVETFVAANPNHPWFDCLPAHLR
jgi:succinyl-diaminopimelate desuccinylase